MASPGTTSTQTAHPCLPPLTAICGPDKATIVLTSVLDANRPAGSPALPSVLRPMSVDDAADLSVALAVAVLSRDAGTGRKVRDRIAAVVKASTKGGRSLRGRGRPYNSRPTGTPADPPPNCTP